MKTEYKLWGDEETVLEYYPSTYKVSDTAILILPGGAYSELANHEGEGYARVFNVFGMTAFVLNEIDLKIGNLFARGICSKKVKSVRRKPFTMWTRGYIL